MHTTMFARCALALGIAACATLAAGPAQAAITGGSANFAELSGASLPATVGQNLTNVDGKLFGFDESVFTLTSDLAVAGGVIKAGTTVASHLVYFDPQTKTKSLSGYVTFDQAILGFITATTSLTSSNGVFGLPTITYGTSGGIGLEGRDVAGIAAGDNHRLNLSLTESAKNPIGDQIRVFTAIPGVSAVPEPSTYAMIGAGLMCVGFMSRRRLG